MQARRSSPSGLGSVRRQQPAATSLKARRTDARYFMQGDAAAFLRSLAILKARKYFLDGPRSALVQLVPSFDKFAWTASERALASRLGPTGFMDGYSIPHQAIHTLVGERYGWSYGGKPRVTLLSEALAGGVELYYELSRASKRGVDERSPTLQKYAYNGKVVKRSFVRLFNRGLQDPFGEFKKTVVEQFRISELLLAYQLKPERRRPSCADLLEELRGFERWPYLHQRDFGGFVLFVLAFCGKKSSKLDRAQGEKILALLEESTSMLRLLEALEGG